MMVSQDASDVSQGKSKINLAISTALSDSEDEDEDFISVAMQASDQLYIAIKTLCLSLSSLYRFYVPSTE